MPPNIVVDDLLVQPLELGHDGVATFHLQSHSLTGIEDYTTGPQADFQFHYFARLQRLSSSVRMVNICWTHQFAIGRGTQVGEFLFFD